MKNNLDAELEWLSNNMDCIFSSFDKAKPLEAKDRSSAPVLVSFANLGKFAPPPPPPPKKDAPPPNIPLPRQMPQPTYQKRTQELSEEDLEAAMLSIDMESFERSWDNKSAPQNHARHEALPKRNPSTTQYTTYSSTSSRNNAVETIKAEMATLAMELKGAIDTYMSQLCAGLDADVSKAHKDSIEMKIASLAQQLKECTSVKPTSQLNNFPAPQYEAAPYTADRTPSIIDTYNAADLCGDYDMNMPSEPYVDDSVPLCNCHLPAVERMSRTEANMNRAFYCCSKDQKAPDRCDFFQWLDNTETAITPIASLGSNIIRDPKVESRRIFGHRDFRPGQLECIQAALQNKDVFCLMPTGGGKSLVYQLPAWCNAGVAVVFSPLLSLIIDQVDALKALGIRAVYLSSVQDDAEIQQLYADLRDVVSTSEGESNGRTIKLLYLTPEKFSKSNKLKTLLNHLYRNNMLSRFILDEAHCVSDWGHDFRADYLALGQLRPTYPNVPIMALTATANQKVIQDSIRIIGMKNPHLHTQSFNRSNISYTLHQKTSSVVADIANIVKSRPTQSGIIYCLSRKETEKLVADLITAIPTMKRSIAFYHAEVRADIKEQRQRLWSKGDIKLMVATIAFGMGINKPDVRYVIHFSLPKSLTNFYQESGRAGRDGFPSESILYFSYGDKQRLHSLLLKGGRGDEEIGSSSGNKSRGLQNALTNLQQCMEYCLNEVDCRRTLLLQYFGEAFPSDKCNNTCDNCRNRGTVEWVDFSSAAVMVINIARALFAKRHNRITVAMFRQLITGSKAKTMEKYRDAIKDMRVLEPSGKEISKQNAEKLLYTMISKGYLDEESVVTMGSYTAEYLILGKHCEDIRREQVRICVKVAAPIRPAGASPDEIENGSNNCVSYDMEEEDSIALQAPVVSASTSRKKKFTIPLTTVQSADSSDLTIETTPKKSRAKKTKVSPAKPTTASTKSSARAVAKINGNITSHEIIGISDDDDDFMVKPAASRYSMSAIAENSPPISTSNSRDTSSRLTLKQKSALRQWLNEYRKRWEIYWNYLNNSTVAEMVEKVPVTIAELSNIGGLGEVKIAQHGKHILATIWSFLQKHQLLDKFQNAQEPEVPECPTWRDPMSHAAEEIRKLDTARQHEAQLGHKAPYHNSPAKSYPPIQHDTFQSPAKNGQGYVSHSLRLPATPTTIPSNVYSATTPNAANTNNALKRTATDADLEEQLDWYAFLVP